MPVCTEVVGTAKIVANVKLDTIDNVIEKEETPACTEVIDTMWDVAESSALQCSNS